MESFMDIMKHLVRKETFGYVIITTEHANLLQNEDTGHSVKDPWYEKRHFQTPKWEVD